MKVFIQAIFAQLLLNPYLFWRGYQALPPRKSCRIPFALLFVIELLVYFTGYLFRNDLPDDVMVAILYLCNTWYIATIYLTLSLLTVEVIALSHRWRPWLPAAITTRWRQTKLTLFVVIVVGVTALLFKANHTVMNPVVKHVYVTLDKPAGDGRDSLTVVMMSDLHIGEMIGKPLVQKYVALSNAQRPDMVVLVGDIMDYESRFAEKQHIEDDLLRLEAPLGVYGVNGNHEYRANRYAKQRWLKKTGIVMLIDSVALPGNLLNLVGRDDQVNHHRLPVHRLIEHLNPLLPTIVLDHQPVSFNEMTMNGIDLALHGHTHNGQLWPYPLAMKLAFECPYGSYRKGGTQFYISSGIGFAGPPYRVGTLSELVVLHIRFGKKG